MSRNLSRLDNYNSSESDSEVEIEENSKKPKQLWADWEVFQTEAEAVEFVGNQNFSHKSVNQENLLTGRKVRLNVLTCFNALFLTNTCF